MFLKGAGGAVLAMPFLESLLPRTASGQAMTPPKRFIVLKSFSTQLIQDWYPRFTGNGYQLHDSKYSGDKADGTTLLTQKLVIGKNYTWAPLDRLPDDDRHLRHPGPGAEPVPVQADADPRPRFPAVGEPQLRRAAGQLRLVHGGHALRRRQHRRRADHRSGDGVFEQGLPEHARAALPAHLAGRDRFDVVFEPGHERRRRAAAQGAHQPARRVQRRVRRNVDGGRRHDTAADARQAADRSRLPGLHAPQDQQPPVGGGQADGRSLRDAGVRAAGQADAGADDVVHASGDAGVDGEQHDPQRHRHHHQVEPVPGHRRPRR